MIQRLMPRSFWSSKVFVRRFPSLPLSRSPQTLLRRIGLVTLVRWSILQLQPHAWFLYLAVPWKTAGQCSYTCRSCVNIEGAIRNLVESNVYSRAEMYCWTAYKCPIVEGHSMRLGGSGFCGYSLLSTTGMRGLSVCHLQCGFFARNSPYLSLEFIHLHGITRRKFKILSLTSLGPQ